ncbi:MAG TPA: hypothetical protein VHB73_06890 [Alphaproteobacteria bacterium]|nr:hypothetical protein [Alphaproteobacteria bacterium]
MSRRYIYGYTLMENGDAVTLRFPKFPTDSVSISREDHEAMNRGEIKVWAEAAVINALNSYISRRRPIPPSDELADYPREHVTLSQWQVAKLEFARAYILQRISRDDLASRFRISRKAINRLLDIRHYTKPKRIAAARKALEAGTWLGSASSTPGRPQEYFRSKHKRRGQHRHHRR